MLFARRFSADPHPGNYLLLDDGRVAFIDFGMSKRVTRDQVEAELEVMQAGIDRDSERLRAALVHMGFFAADDPVITGARVQEHFDAFCDELSRRFGWDLGHAHVANQTTPVEVPESLREQIAADHEVDAQLYRFALDHCTAPEPGPDPPRRSPT